MSKNLFLSPLSLNISIELCSGHALGIMHSKQQNAVMYAEYPDNAFDFTGLHSDDILAVKTNYPGKRGMQNKCIMIRYKVFNYESLQLK